MRILTDRLERFAHAIGERIAAWLIPVIKQVLTEEIKKMADQVNTDLQTINTSLTDLASKLTTISTDLQNLKSAAPVGVVVTQDTVDLIHKLAANAQAADAQASAIVQPDVAPTGTTSASGASGTDAVTGSAS